MIVKPCWRQFLSSSMLLSDIDRDEPNIRFELDKIILYLLAMTNFDFE